MSHICGLDKITVYVFLNDLEKGIMLANQRVNGSNESEKRAQAAK